MLIITSLSLPIQAQPDSGHIKIGVYNNPPLIFNSDDNQAEGLFADLIDEMSRQQGWKIEYVPGNFNELLQKLKDKQIDVLPVIAYSDERTVFFDFNQQNVLTNWAQIYTAKGSNIRSLPDLSAKKVAVLQKDIHYSAFKHLMDQFGLASEVFQVDSYDQVLQLVADGTVDAGITNRFFGKRNANRFDVEESGVIFNPIKIHFAFPKNENSELLRQIDQQLLSLKNDRTSTYYKSIEKWLGDNLPIKSVLPVVLSILFLLGLVLFLIYLLFTLAPVRRALGLSTVIEQRVIVNVLIVTLFIAIFTWCMISMLDYLWFNPSNKELINYLLPLNDQNRMFYRMILVGSILLGGMLISRLFLRLISGQQQVQQSEQLFQLTTSAGKTGVWDWNLITNDIYLAPYLKQMLGYLDDEIKNHMDDWTRYVHPDDKEKISLAADAAVDNPDTDFQIEYRMLHRNGGIVWMLAHGSVIRDEQGKAIRMLGTDTDISTLKVTQYSLQVSENRFRNLFENSEVSLWDEDLTDVFQVLEKLRASGETDLRNYCQQNPDFLLDLASRVKVNHVNLATLKLFNADNEKTFLMQINQTFGPGAMDVFLESLCAFWEDRDIFRSVANYFSFDGRPIQAIVSYRVPKKRIDYKNVAITLVDISDRKQALKALVENQELLKEAQSIAHMGNWELDPKTMKAVWSEEIFSMFGMDVTDDVGPACLETLLHEGDRECVMESLKTALQGGKHHMEYRVIRPDNGIVRWIECQAVQKYDDKGKILKIRGVVQDITNRKETEQKLIFLKEESERSESKFKSITEQATEGITVADMDGNYSFVNKAFCDMVGYSEQELITMTVFDVKAPEQDTSSFERTKGSEEGLEVEVYLQRKDGSVFIAEVIGKVIEFGGHTQVLGTIRDITRQVKADEQIRTLSQAVEQSPVSVMITDTSANIEYVNNTFEKITGYSFEEIRGENPRFLNSGNNPVNLYQELWKAIGSGNNWQGEIQNCKKNGELFWEYAHFSPVLDEYGQVQHYLAMKEDITLRKQQEEHIIHQAHFDNLTSLPNRFLSLDRLSQLMEEAKRENSHVAVLFLDLDDFKKVNDTLGHETGDKLLVEASERLKSIIRTGDTVGRFGGDEFIILLGGLKSSVDAQPVTENLLNRFRDAFRIDGRELMITLSVGIALYPDDGDNASELLRNADSAMYYSKQLGRNTYSYFTDEMNLKASKRLAIEEQIHGALDRGEFSVYYQPKVAVNSGQIIGAEALLRWSNPALGSVSPEEFIPISEQTGLIVNLGKFVLSEALTQAAQWQKNYDSHFNIAVNISPRQFRDPDLINNIGQALTQSGVSSELLELEITEGVLMSGHGYIDEALEVLNKLGVSIAMDDFGTGYSSLSYLRTYPFDVLKIDRSFINDISIDSADRELINAAIAMAHGLNLKVVAEGVETKQQLAYLKELHCDFAQGYFFSKPVSAEKMTRLLESTG